MSDPSQNVLNLVKDDKKYQLLQNRLAGSEVGIINTSPIKFQPIRSDKETSIATLEDNIPSQADNVGEFVDQISPEEIPKKNVVSPTEEVKPPENVVIVLDGSTDASSPSHLSISNKTCDPEVNQNSVGEKRPRTAVVATDDEANSNSRDGCLTDSLERSRSFPSKSRKTHHGGEPLDRSLIPQNDTGSREAKLRKGTIVSYFTTISNNVDASVPPVSSSDTSKSGHSTAAFPVTTSSSGKAKQPKEANATATVLTKEEKLQITDLRKSNEQFRVAKEQAEMKFLRLEADFKAQADKIKLLEERNSKLTKALEEVYRTTAQQEFRRKRERLALDSVRLGKITTSRSGPNSYQDYWEEGYAWKDLTRRNAEVIEKKEELDSRKKKSEKLKRQAKKNTNANSAAEPEDSSNVTLNLSEIDADLDLITEMEAIKAHQEQLRKDEATLQEEKRLLESEKAVHQKEWRRCINEERSRFYRELPLLKDRYLLMTMLGKGGFSEVWKAMDIHELKEVAVKIHQLNPTWSEERKSSYIKHVSREYTIHRDMKHPRVVQLFDVFEIDVNSFATVLEYCRGIDLDEKLKRQRTISEKDAKAIMMQIMSGLRYLNHPFAYPNAISIHNNSNNGVNVNEDNSGITAVSSSSGGPNIITAMNKKLSIIHYDLKPANILFDEFGDVKITDFGLSKVIDESCDDNTSLELTSQGAGTYWYLPPECFEKGPQPPRISSKVDVWSAGVIFYQMLFGTRPFGEGKTQEHVWSENIISNANYVEFPTDPKAPKVSEEAKDLIRACLTKDPRLRPDIITICQHSYLKKS